MTAPRHQAAVPVFDQVRASITPGEHVVARYPGVLLVLRRDGAAGADVIAALLDICHDVTSAAPRSPGRPLARRLTGWLSQTDDAPGFGTVAATEDGLAIFLHGAVTVDLPDGPVAGRAAAFTVDRLVDWPEAALRLAADAPAGAAADTEPVPDWMGLHRGVVTGSSVVLHVGAAGTTWTETGAGPPSPASADPETSISPAVPTPPDAELSGLPLTPPTPPVVFDKIFGVAPDEAPRAPLPLPNVAVAPAPAPVATPAVPKAPAAPPDGAHDHAHDHPHPTPPAPKPGPPPVRAPAPPTGLIPTPPKAEQGSQVLGYRCSREHLNDPRVSFCSQCGIRMDQRTGVLVRGRRPPLGLIVLDAGSTFVLDDDYLLGRDPEGDPEVQAGRLRPLRLEDNSGTMSRAHVEIRLHDWDVTVVDRGSANGTFVSAPRQQGWSAVVPHQPFELVAGSQVGIGRRGFTFESPHGRL